MRSATTTAGGAFLIGFATALLAGLGCSTGGDGTTTTMPQLSCRDDGAAAPNAIDMNCGGAAAGVTEQVDFVIGGPLSGSTTLRGFNFDVIYDASKLEFVPGTSYASPLASSALVVVSLANGQPGRVVVSIQQLGTLPDVSVGPGQHPFLRLLFRRVAGATFGPTPVAFDPSNSEVTNASTMIDFAGGLALAFQ